MSATGLYDQRFIADDAIGVDELIDNALAASADGRGKMQNGFFDSTTTVADKFAAASIGLDRLEEAVIQADGGQAFTADQPMGGFHLTGLGAGSAPGDSVRYEQVVLVDGTNAFTGDQSMGGNKLTSVGNGTLSTDAVNLGQLNDAITGLDKKASVRFATTADLPANTPSGSGVGKTLQADANGAFPTTDGVTPAVNDRVLVKDYGGGASSIHNGIYDLTQLGDGSNPWILTRATDADQDAEVTANLFVFAEEGTANGDKGFTLVTNNPITVDTTALQFTIFTTSAAQDLAGVLTVGNTTGGTDISVSSGDKIVGALALLLESTGLGLASLSSAPNGGAELRVRDSTTVAEVVAQTSVLGGDAADTTNDGQVGSDGGTVNITAGDGADGTDGTNFGTDAGEPGAGAPVNVTGGIGGKGGSHANNGSRVEHAKAGGDVCSVGGVGGAGDNAQTIVADPAKGGDVKSIGGAGGAGVGTSNNANGGDFIARGGAAGTGGSGTAGTDGNVLLGDQDTNDIILGNTTDLNDIIFRSQTQSYTLTAGAALTTTAQTIIEAINEAASTGGATYVGNETITAQAITGTNTALTDTIDNTPNAGSVSFFLNGARMIEGVHFSIATATITWLAASSGFNMLATDTIRISYTH